MIYYTADPHFGHEAILHFCHRPFADVEEMNRVLMENWNSVVQAEDEVYLLGDVFFKGRPEEILPRLNRNTSASRIMGGVWCCSTTRSMNGTVFSGAAIIFMVMSTTAKSTALCSGRSVLSMPGSTSMTSHRRHSTALSGGSRFF